MKSASDITKQEWIMIHMHMEEIARIFGAQPCQCKIHAAQHEREGCESKYGLCE